MMATGINGFSMEETSMAKSTKILDPLNHWLDKYLPDVEGKSGNTIRSYKDTWRIFMQYMVKNGTRPADVTYSMLTYEEVVRFLDCCEKDRGNKASTRNSRRAALSKFSEYAENIDFNAAHEFHRAMKKIPAKKNACATERAYFMKEEVKILLNLPTANTPMGYRDHVLLPFMYASGCRADEVCGMKVKDVRFLEEEKKTSVLLHEKGGKTRRIKISPEPSAALMKYIRHRGISSQREAYVFPSQRNEKMGLKCVEDIFGRYISKARKEHPDLFLEKSYPPHSMRHTTAVHMLEAGVPLVVVKQFLGHAHISTTEIYARLSPKVVLEQIAMWDKKYWDEYMDEDGHDAEGIPSDDGIPGFLK